MLANFFSVDDRNSALVIDDYEALDRHLTHGDFLNHAIVDPEIEIRQKSKVFVERRFTNVSFSRCAFKRITFRKCVFVDCLFIGTTFVECEFHQCIFKDCNAWKASFTNVYLDPATVSFDNSYRRTHANVGLGLFQSLYTNAQSLFQLEFATAADVSRRRWRRYELIWQRKQNRIGRAAFSRRFLENWLFDQLARYGYGPVRFFAYSLVLFVLVSLPLHFAWDEMGLTRNGALVGRGDLSQTLFYTGSIITTLGFSELVPSTVLGRVYSMALAFGGIAWVGVFTAILVRRIIR